MATAPKIESSDLTIEQVYKDFYVVPDYQREYVWSDNDVQTFADDIQDEFYGSKGELLPDREYFIGSIVVCRNAQGVFELIDGQQRMTTIFLFLCAIRDTLRAAGAQASKSLEAMIYDTRPGDDGVDVQDFRLLLQYEDSRDILVRIGRDGDPGVIGRDGTESMRCIAEAYKTLREFLKDEFHSDAEEIRHFFVAFIRRVKLIRIVTPNLAHALKVFETVNDRGVGLTAMDLLKNLLFMRTPSADYPKLKDLWKELTRHLELCKEKPLRFLRYYVMANYKDFRNPETAKPVREDELYDWFTKRAKQIGIDDAPLTFARDLADAARDYSRFARGLAPDDRTPILYLDNIQKLSGKARQHFILMLAARHLPAEALQELARHVESLFFVFVIIREPTKNFEWMFGDWSEDLRNAQTVEDVQDMVRRRIEPQVSGKSRPFDFAMGELATKSVPGYRLKYVLAKLAQYVDQVAWQGEKSGQQLDHYLDGKLEIEHIRPQKPREGRWPAFDKPGLETEYTQRLGNLTLLEKPLNTAVGNEGFDKKLEAYRESKIMLTRAIGDPEVFGKNTSLQRAMGLLSDATMKDDGGQADTEKAWTSTQIDQRQQALVRLARIVWLVDQAHSVDPAAAAESAPTPVGAHA